MNVKKNLNYFIPVNFMKEKELNNNNNTYRDVLLKVGSERVNSILQHNREVTMLNELTNSIYSFFPYLKNEYESNRISLKFYNNTEIKLNKILIHMVEISHDNLKK